MSGFDADARTSPLTLRNGTHSPLPSISLNRQHIAEALSKSPDNGVTLDLAHKGLTDVGETGAEELATAGEESGTESTVVRIALAYNRLTTLPMAFALLSRLRYLVLKNNNFSVFPDVLTVMPSLEILDISRNKIKRLPSQPGSLVKLRVFSIFRNKIHRLPPYISKFQELTLFKVDQNPIDWPPKSVMDSSGNLDDPHDMAEWIESLKIWIENNAPSERKMSEDSIQDEHSHNELHFDLIMAKNPNPVQQLTMPHDPPQATALYHARSFSLESDTSTYFQLERSQKSTGPDSFQYARSDWSPSLQPPHFPHGPDSSSPSPSRSPERVIGGSDEQASSTDEDNKGSLSKGQQPVHARNASYAGGGHKSSRSRLALKKSLPDLRPLKLQVATGRPDESTAQWSGTAFELNGFSADHPTTSSQGLPTVSPSSIDRPAPPMDIERNSYFRRLSTLKPLSLSKTIPEALLSLVDAVRGVLFGVSHIYQTLQHYTVYAIDERLSAVLLKVLDPASIYMTQLINALDRFDSMSRRTLPSPAVCRAVVESCRDNVTVFGKAVGVLALQLKVLATHDDVRYTRQMLLVLYGAMAEIATSWQTIASRMDAVKPLLREARPPPVAKSHAVQVRAARSTVGTDSTRSPVSAPPIASASFTLGQDQQRLPLRSGVADGSLDHPKIRMTRRHAGSFSSKDVEIGKMLPSYVDTPHLTGGVINGSASETPVLRTARRQATPAGSPPATNGSQNPESSLAEVNSRSTHQWDAHSRQGSHGSFVVSSSSSSSSSLALKANLLDNLSSTSTLVDREAIEAMKQALEAAPAIWAMMDEILNDAQGTKEDLRETLSKAKDVAQRLSENICMIQDGAPAVDRKPLHDDARTFAKTVIQLSNAIKTHVAAHPLSSTVRTNMVKLTNATEEFVILLHVSSFSPAPTPRPYSPMVGLATQPSTLGLPEDGRLGANLSRSRSVLPSASSKLASNLREPPHSALPHQSFAIPTPRYRPLRKDTVGDAAPVPA
ncbi:hypothetical protein AcV7_008910 [Taiwanofungus camphoratus]|nr:hypothetical protein AcV7_008910 [Antrodia cinnamomea]